MNEKETKNTCDMDASENLLQTCQNYEVVDRDISPAGVNRIHADLKECFVPVIRMSEDEIIRLCGFKCTDRVSSIMEEILNKTVKAVDDEYDSSSNYSKKENEDIESYKIRRNVRYLSKSNQDKFEHYKQRRQGFIKRRNRISVNSENSLDLSQDEFKGFDSPAQEKKKKKCKRGRKYERDSEWSPYTFKGAVPGKRMTRRAIIESDTSQSDDDDDDDDDMLYSYYDDIFSDSTSNSTFFQNIVPSEPEAGSNFQNTGEQNLHESNTSPNSNSVNSSLSESHNSGDILSDIMKKMDECKGKVTNKAKRTSSVISNQEMSVQKKRKRLKKSCDDRVISDADRNSIVSTILSEMVHTISAQAQLSGENQKFSKKCRYCDTEFSTSKETETMCYICYDTGRSKYKCTPNKTTSAKLKSHVKQKASASKLGKKGNNTMFRVLKNLPKNEMQRLMYVEKTDKLSLEKKYNHCKSLNASNSSDKLKKLPMHATNTKVDKNISKCVEDGKGCNLPAKKVVEINKTNSKESNRISLEKCKDGLFLMTFPDSNKECRPWSSVAQDKNSVNICSRATNVNKPSPVQQMTTDDQYQTYLLPPVPTVVVANYSSTNDKCGDYQLLNVFYQNEFTKNTIRNSSAPDSRNQLPLNVDKTKFNNSFLTTNITALQNCSVAVTSPLLNNRSITITNIPIQTRNLLTSNSVNSVSVNAPVSLLPVVSSVVSLSNQNRNQSTTSNFQNLFIPNNFVNSEQLPIKITHVSSGNEQASKMSNYSQLTTLPNISNIESNNKINSPPVNSSMSETTTKCNAILTSNKTLIQQRNSVGKMLSQSEKNISKESEKNSVNEQKNIADDDPINPALELIEAISILAVIDLEKNPHAGLNFRIKFETSNLEKLKCEENIDTKINDKIATSERNLRILRLADKYLKLYGNFAKVSDYFLRKEKMIQIKKEMLSEEEVAENSCQFSQNVQFLESYNSESKISSHPIMTSSSSLKSETFSSCRLNEKSGSVNHIEKMQSQVAAINNNQTVNEPLPNGTIHHYAGGQIVMPTAVAAPTPVTPRNDYLASAGGESRETPSRGSGPRTPARPESATSQPEEQALTALQIKKERLESASPSPSQCAFSQNNLPPSNLPSMPSMTDINSSINMPGHSINNNVQQVNVHQISVSTTDHSLISTNSIYKEMTSNRTIMYNNNQNYSNVFVNLSGNQQIGPNTVSTINTGMQQNRQVVIRQPIFTQDMTQKQTVPSVNSNQYLIRPPPYSSASGAVLVNHGQNVNALLTNVSNQQFYTPKQVTQLFYPPASQMNCIQNDMPSVSNIHNQQIGRESLDQMVCAVCKNIATLRCKQCAKVAYCNTSCAKTYWHQRHKMECKPMQSCL